MNKYQKELEFAKNLALKTGEIMLKYFRLTKTITKSNLTPVTEADIAISKMVIKEVKKFNSKHKVLDEEKQNTDIDSEYLWVCDPIDGTVPYSHHVPTSMFSLALCKNQEPIVAVTYDPYIKRMFYTKKGDYSYMNGKRIAVNKEGFKRGNYIYGLPRVRNGFNTNKLIKLLGEKGIKTSIIESIVYESMLLASGIIKAVITSAGHPWDRGAASLIIENAGGVCTNEKGKKTKILKDQKYFVASNGTVHNQVLEILQKSIDK